VTRIRCANANVFFFSSQNACPIQVMYGAGGENIVIKRQLWTGGRAGWLPLALGQASGRNLNTGIRRA